MQVLFEDIRLWTVTYFQSFPRQKTQLTGAVTCWFRTESEINAKLPSNQIKMQEKNVDKLISC